MKGSLFSINLSKTRGVARTPVKSAVLREDFGLEGDARSGPGQRQVSLLAIESIRKQPECPKANKRESSFGPGDFSESITTEGLDLARLEIGDRLNIGAGIILEISKIGKECHKYCAIYHKLGDCVIPREAIFAKIIKSGRITAGDGIEVI